MVMGAPDKDVRAARDAVARAGGGAGRSLLARLLLRFLAHLSQLDRKLLLLVVAAPLSACVIPAGPEFQDPAGLPDQPPFFLSYNPAINAEVTSPFFEVTATDQNVGDSLHFRWLADFPESVPRSRRTLEQDMVVKPSTDGSPLRALSMQTVDCLVPGLIPTVDRHRIMVIVARSRPSRTSARIRPAVSETATAIAVTWLWT